MPTLSKRLSRKARSPLEPLYFFRNSTGSHPRGVTGVLVLAESHISIHTWPEHSYAALDVFMCSRARPKEAIAVLKQEFKPTHVVEYLLARGRANNAEQDRQPDRIDSERWLKGLDR
ncbi:MAG: adenosylmethionine decarboxylase [Mesorhizobium sp.]|nr:MAG: adenosylmethionine decarboxylase [Mesorhizobium sp.]